MSGNPESNVSPVIETSLSVQFEGLPKLRITDYGLFWQTIMEDFPIVEEHQPIPPMLEPAHNGAPSFAASAVQWQIGSRVALPRAWFRSVADAHDERAIQLQPDRFTQNWRRVDRRGQTPPTYDQNRDEFARYFGAFERFLEAGDLGEIRANQCEVSHVSRIPMSGTAAETFNSCFPSLARRSDGASLPEPERFQQIFSFLIPDAGGRLHAMIQAPIVAESGELALDFRLTARGAPKVGDNGIIDWLDLGHAWVLKGIQYLAGPGNARHLEE